MDKPYELSALIRALRAQYRRLNPPSGPFLPEFNLDYQYGAEAKAVPVSQLPPVRAFSTNDAPTRNGRHPQPGEQEWVLHWTLDDGAVLYLTMGEGCRNQFRAWMLREELDDYADQVVQNL